MNQRALCRQSDHRNGKKCKAHMRPASSYHLPEGRYFEADFILKKTTTARKCILSLMLGASLGMIPSFEWKGEVFLPTNSHYPADNTTILVSKNNKRVQTGSQAARLIVRDHAKNSSLEAKRIERLQADAQNISRPEQKQKQLSIAGTQDRVAVTLSSSSLPRHVPRLPRLAKSLPITQSDNHKLQMTRLVGRKRPPPREYDITRDKASQITQAAQAPQSTRTEIFTPQDNGHGLIIPAEMQAGFAHNLNLASPVKPIEAVKTVRPEDDGQSSGMLPEQARNANQTTISTPTRLTNSPAQTSAGTISEYEQTAIAFHLPEQGPFPRPKQLRALPVSDVLKHLVSNNEPDILALGYTSLAMTDIQSQSPFDGILTQENLESQGRFVPPIGAKDHAWAANPLPPKSFESGQQKCLAEAIYFEARSESLKGQAAVAQVVLNRVRNPAYPASICAVVYQNVKWRGRCQFSFACDGKKRHISQPEHWQIAQDIAIAVTAGQIWLPEIGSSTHYHATYVRPRWARSMIKLEKIGLHIFYRTRYGGWS